MVDGDTIWLAGEKIRLEGIDAPEVEGRCRYEKDLARKAAERLRKILSGQSFKVVRNGKDRYDRTLAQLQTTDGEAGTILVREGLARKWTGRKEPWCTR